METATFNYLHVTLGKREALNLYYRLTGFIREHDTIGFSRFMAFRDSSLKDDALMEFVLDIMVTRHQDMLVQFMPATGNTVNA
ncbi:hypothetical protein ACFS7Z_16525 [Pontibacter toksunensis]|uniref:Uncharacterized protein n=1 Tax=Pontibacter toksunensis TaxID=1332631 RepID=A0ABW6BW04_9BACT